MPFVVDVLDVAGKAIWLITGNHNTIRAGFNFAVMASATCGARREAVDWIERLVTTRARQLSLRVSGNARHGTHALHVHGVELLAAPLFVGISRQPRDCDPL